MTSSISQVKDEMNDTSKVVEYNVLYQVKELIKKGRELAKKDDLQRAILFFEKAKSIDPSNLSVIQQYSTALINAQRYEDAKTIFKKFIEANPNNIQSILIYCKILVINNEREIAFGLLQSIIDVQSENIEVLTFYAELLSESQEYVEACKLFDRCLQIEPKNIGILNSYANILVKTGENQQAIELFDKAIYCIQDNNFKSVGLSAQVISDYLSLLLTNNKLDKANSVIRSCFIDVTSSKITFLSRTIKSLRSKVEYPDLLKKFLSVWLSSNETNKKDLFTYLEAVFRAKKEDSNKFFEICECWLKIEQNNVDLLNMYVDALVKEQKIDIEFELFAYILQLMPNNTFVLNSYANALVEKELYQEAYKIFEQSFKLDPQNIITVKNYANALLQQELYQDALCLFYQKDIQVIISYADTLVSKKNFEGAISFFEYALKLEANNTEILYKLSKILLKNGSYERGYELLKYYLNIDKNNITILSMFANVCIYQEKYDEAITTFEYILKLGAEDYRIIYNYANLLFKTGRYSSSLHLFEQAIQIEPHNHILLTNYAITLTRLEEFPKAFNIFELALQEKENDILVLTNYAKALAIYGDFEKSYELFEKALLINSNDFRTFNDYKDLLTQSENWKKLIELQPSSSYARWKYSQNLESKGEYSEALFQLLSVNLISQKDYHANIIRLNIGRLYYRLGQADLGKRFFDEAIANSEDQDQSKLYAARSLLANDPNSEEAIDLLRQIQEDSPRYAEAMKAIAVNANSETSYDLFAGNEASVADTEMLYRAMYHKIGNEVAILKSIAYRLLRQIEKEQPIVREIVQNLEELLASISKQRATEKVAISGIPKGNYRQILETVSKTAHDISDDVNNQLAVIESKTRRTMRKISSESPQFQNFEKFLLQLELTQTALNDLKSINEGMSIRKHRFRVSQLFEKWQPTNWTNKPRIDGVRIQLDIRNPNAEFDGDEEKIKSILNELVENSLKHNQNNSHLFIRMFSNDIDNPMDVSTPTIPGDRKFLYIEFTDNGEGIPDDKKDWIFQPLNTTSPENKGSGLGLFIARKTLEKMGGRIRVGESDRGARFQIYLPYLSDNLE